MCCLFHGATNKRKYFLLCMVWKCAPQKIVWYSVSLVRIDLNQTSIVRLACDGCGGQNKNFTVVRMLGKWFYTKASEGVKKIIINFLIVGHSFISPDRGFGVIEKKMRMKEMIIACIIIYYSGSEESSECFNHKQARAWLCSLWFEKCNKTYVEIAWRLIFCILNVSE